MMLAEIQTGEIWIVVCSVAGTVISLIALLVVAFKKTEMQLSPQPLIVAMEKEFTTKHEFEKHVASNVVDVNNLFSKIGGVERGSRESLQREIAQINADRKQSLETINRKNERMMFALGKIAQKLNVDIEPTE